VTLSFHSGDKENVAELLSQPWSLAAAGAVNRHRLNPTASGNIPKIAFVI
jgi:hypothetical protein